MSTSRAEILKAIRRHLPESSPLPPLDGPWIQYPDPMDQFDKVLQMIGGRMVHVPHLEAVANDLQSLAPFAQSKKSAVRSGGFNIFSKCSDEPRGCRLRGGCRHHGRC